MAHGLRELIPATAIRERVAELGAKIAADYADKPLILVGVLKGAFVFLADLVRTLPAQTRVDFVRLSSYGDQDSPQELSFTMDLSLPTQDAHLLVVEDIIDTGRSMAMLKTHLQKTEAASVKICALIDKRCRREVEIEADYAGFTVPRGFLVGYGLDYAEGYRGLPGIYELTAEGR